MTSLTPAQFEVIRHLAQAPKEHALEFVRYETSARNAAIGSLMLIASTRVVNALVEKGLIMQVGTHITSMRLTDAGLQYCIEKGLIETPVNVADADAIETQRAEDLQVEAELERLEATHETALAECGDGSETRAMLQHNMSDENPLIKTHVYYVEDGIAKSMSQSIDAETLTQALFGKSREEMRREISAARALMSSEHFIDEIEAALLAVGNPSGEWLKAFYARHGVGFETRRPQCTGEQAQAMMAELQSIQWKIKHRSAADNNALFAAGLYAARTFEHGRDYKAFTRQLCFKVSGERCSRFEHLKWSEVPRVIVELEARCDQYAAVKCAE